MKPKFSIAPVTPAEVPALAALEAACFSRPLPADLLRRQLESGTHVLLAAHAAGALAGYAGFMHVLDEGYVTNVAVAAAYRRQGIGAALVDALVDRAKELGLAFLTLEVRASNGAARALYVGRGFREAGRRKSYYEAPVEDAVLMTFPLS